MQSCRHDLLCSWREGEAGPAATSRHSTSLHMSSSRLAHSRALVAAAWALLPSNLCVEQLHSLSPKSQWNSVTYMSSSLCCHVDSRHQANWAFKGVPPIDETFETCQLSTGEKPFMENFSCKGAATVIFCKGPQRLSATSSKIVRSNM